MAPGLCPDPLGGGEAYGDLLTPWLDLTGRGRGKRRERETGGRGGRGRTGGTRWGGGKERRRRAERGRKGGISHHTVISRGVATGGISVYKPSQNQTK